MDNKKKSHDDDDPTNPDSGPSSFINLPANSSGKLSAEDGITGSTTADNLGYPLSIKNTRTNSTSLLLKPFTSSNLIPSASSSSTPRKPTKKTPTGMHSRTNESGDSFRFMTRTPSHESAAAQNFLTPSSFGIDHEYGNHNNSQTSVDLNLLRNPSRPPNYHRPSSSIASGFTTADHRLSTRDINQTGVAFNNGENRGKSSVGEPEFKAKPSIDYHDMLWAEMDILDDVKSMAQQTITNGSFFGKKHAEALEQLKKAQVRLAHEICSNDKQIGEYDHRKIWEANDIESVKKTLFSQEHFKNVSDCVENTLAKLNDVGEVMKVVDDRSRDMWNNS
ncbi:hypothetical protein NADFUDRAFT_42032 [Nadsonia fulvescens var. elongata DSM 6958]|uniref:Uncharacterized protein n=1 Tax=Nadsonia fulvescens var. elongata DSM 6958 TaxID=857566 RepID=A0A1E3PMJ9_9ASCO|nr:hypothetical protein NADFUDRAFT_42032 [Nadsonia fulvescens var. elongata DSM 6958]